MYNRLIRHTFNFGLGSFLPQLIGFFLLPVYTHYLSPEDYGILELVASISAFIMIFMRLGVPGAIVRFFFDYKDPGRLVNYITTVHHFLLTSSLAVGLLVAAGYPLFGEALFPGVAFWPFIVYGIFNAMVSSNTDIQRRLLLAREQSAYSAKLNTAMAFVGIGLALFFVVVLKQGLIGIILANVISGTIFFFQAQWYLRKDIKGKFQKEHLIPSLKYGMGVLPSHIITPFANVTSRSVLTNYESLASLGVYSIAMKFVSPLTLITGALSNAYQPIYYSARISEEEEEMRKVSKASKMIWLIGTFIYVSVVFLAPSVIRLLTPERFHESGELVPFLAINFLIGILNILFSLEIHFSKKTFWVSVISVARISANLGVLFLTIDEFGVYAIIFGILADSLVSLIIGLTVSARLFQFDRNLGFIAKSVVFMVGSISLFYYLKMFFESNLGVLSLGLLHCLMYISLYFIFREYSIKEIVTLIKKRKIIND